MKHFEADEVCEFELGIVRRLTECVAELIARVLLVDAFLRKFLVRLIVIGLALGSVGAFGFVPAGTTANPEVVERLSRARLERGLRGTRARTGWRRVSATRGQACRRGERQRQAYRYYIRSHGEFSVVGCQRFALAVMASFTAV